MRFSDWVKRNSTRLTLMVFIVVVFFITLSFEGCGKTKAPSQAHKKKMPGIARAAKKTLLAPKPGATLFLTQAQFIYKPDDTTKSNPLPGPARLIIFRSENGKWKKEVLEDSDSNVFHKAAWYQPPEGKPGILTIGAMQAQLKLWRKTNGKWVGTSLWNPTFGGKFDRLRDFEVGDVTGDGVDDIVIATHDQGVVAVAYWDNGTCKVHELTREGNTFVHEIELGDIDGDGVKEIFCTPSKPNKLDGSIQPGRVSMWSMKSGKWQETDVDMLKTRHAKEILCVTLTGDKLPVLFASLEGERIGGTDQSGDTTRIRMYRFEKGNIIPIDIASLPGQLCRFLTYGDTDGDGKKELIASTKSSGIWKLTPPAEGAGKDWRKTLIASHTSGFEHATYLFDANGDGKDEIYVASDDQREMRCYWFDGKRYSVTVLDTLKDNTITFNITAAFVKNHI